MQVVTIGLAASTLIAMAIVMTYILGWASKAFYVEVDPRIDDVNKALPGANCGGCGYIGCGEYAEAVVLKNAPVTKCTVGGESCAAMLAQIMNLELGETLPFRPVVHCGASYDDRLGRSLYLSGENRCMAANLVTDIQGCIYGCLGFGDCYTACNYDAINLINGLATVDYEKCVGCGACAKVCPRNIITMTPFKYESILAVICSNKDTGKEVTRVCNVGCIACTACSRISDIFVMENNLSVINYDKYSKDSLEDLLKASKKCPRKRIKFVGKPPVGYGDQDDRHEPEVVTPDFKTTVDDTEWRG
jgi:RnfABCDGE-type electron transport complex B subunit